MLFGGLLMERFGWRPFFIALGFGSMLWIVPWMKWMPQNRHPTGVDTSGVPSLREFVQFRSAWGTCLGLFCGNYTSYFLLTWLPFFLVRERHFSMSAMAKIGGIAYILASGASALCGWLSDRWIARGATASLSRKTFTGGGMALSGLSLFFAVLVGPKLCVVAIIFGVVFFGALASNLWSITQTLAGPKAAGRWTGFQSFVGNLAGIAAPAVTGYVLQRTGQFFWAFLIVTVVALIGAASWIFLVGPVEQVPWRGATGPLSVPVAEIVLE